MFAFNLFNIKISSELGDIAFILMSKFARQKDLDFFLPSIAFNLFTISGPVMAEMLISTSFVYQGTDGHCWYLLSTFSLSMSRE
jgi:hypothetical protein